MLQRAREKGEPENMESTREPGRARENQGELELTRRELEGRRSRERKGQRESLMVCCLLIHAVSRPEESQQGIGCRRHRSVSMRPRSEKVLEATVSSGGTQSLASKVPLWPLFQLVLPFL